MLDALGLCDPPYRIRGETWVEVQTQVDTEDGRITLEGRIDALTVQDDFWLVVIEGKRGGFSVLRAVLQAIAYMVGAYPTVGGYIRANRIRGYTNKVRLRGLRVLKPA